MFTCRCFQLLLFIKKLNSECEGSQLRVLNKTWKDQKYLTTKICFKLERSACYKKKKKTLIKKGFHFLTFPSFTFLFPSFFCFHAHLILQPPFPFLLSFPLSIFWCFFHKLFLPVSHPCTALDHLSLPWNLDNLLVSFHGSECRARKMPNVIKIREYLKLAHIGAHGQIQKRMPT